MLWGATGVLVLATLFSVLSASPIDDGEPSLQVLLRNRRMQSNVGDKKAIFCKGINLPANVTWYTPSGEIVPEKDRNNTSNTMLRVQVERKIDHDGFEVASLVIHDVKLSDNGVWVCKSGEYNDTARIIVVAMATISTKSEKMEGDEGKSITMHCVVTGSPVPVVQWYKDLSPINDNEKYTTQKKSNTYSLEIKNLSYKDVGDYTCKATQKALLSYTDKTITLLVRHAPILNTAKLIETYGILSELKNLSCSARAFPPPTYTWYRTSNGFDKKVPPEQYATDEDGNESIFSLKLRAEDDLGQYKCKISNNKGSELVIFDVSLGTKPPSPDSIALLSSNDSSIMFNVSCSSCNFQPQPEGMSANPENLTVIGFQFQLTPFVKDYPPNWEAPFESLIEVTEDEMYVVGGLPNMTDFHVRVRSLNSAGYSDWFESDSPASTTAHAVRLVATSLLMMAALLLFA